MLEDDGGGSPSTVVDIAGIILLSKVQLFKLKLRRKKKRPLYDKRSKIEWDKLCNYGISFLLGFQVAAIQDYKREL
jgi:hypothetical protein